MEWLRISRHLTATKFRLRQSLPPAALARIEAAIAEAEQGHQGQIRFAAEHALELGPLLRGQSARERAIEVFSQLRVWDTEHNNGVLIYLLWADRDVEIVADRGIHERLGTSAWDGICRQMEASFRRGDFEGGVIGGIRAVGAELVRHFPREAAGKADELPNQPVLL